MALQHHPRVGEILLCVFPADFSPPEMVKTRPVVVISPRMQGRPNLVSIVPLSTTAPAPIERHHYRVPIHLMPKPLQSQASEVWAKCDMLYTFSLDRLDRFKAGRERGTGKRLYATGQLGLEQIIGLRICIAAALGITQVEP